MGIKANSDRVLIDEENLDVDVPKFQCDNIEKEVVDDAVKSAEVINRENNIVKVEYIDFLDIDTY